MNLNHYYRSLYDKSITEIKMDRYHIDPYIDAETDNRYGLSLIIQPSEETKLKIEQFIQTLKTIEPHQYYYPTTDIHITLMSIISCYEGFDYTTLNLHQYIHLINSCVPEMENSHLKCEGLTASPAGIMVQGFMMNNFIDTFRQNLRKTFKTSKLQQSLDQRYVLNTGHATIVRFRKKLNNKDRFLKVIEDHLESHFGTFEIKNVQLVSTDWYHRQKLVKSLYTYPISNEKLSFST